MLSRVRPIQARDWPLEGLQGPYYAAVVALTERIPGIALPGC